MSTLYISKNILDRYSKRNPFEYLIAADFNENFDLKLICIVMTIVTAYNYF